MKRLMQWFRELLHRYWLKLKLSRFFLFVLGVTIGATGVFCYIEGEKLWDVSIKGYGVVVEARAETVALVTPQGDVSGLAGDTTESFGSPSLEEIAGKVYQLESSSGVNDDKCHRIGGHNGYGFGQGAGRNFCLESDDAVKKLVVAWFDEKLKNGVPLENALCIYNQGVDTNQCDYASKFNAV